MLQETCVTEGFSFRCDLLKSGDVLLCTAKKNFSSAAIRLGTRGKFSHTAICTISPLFIEAAFPGVAEFSLNRLNVSRRESVRILRLKPTVPNSETFAYEAANAALRFQTRKYDKIAAVASIAGGARVSSGIFCSYLVASAYAVAKLNITKTKKSPAATTPKDIQTSDHFDDITDKVLVPARFSNNGIHYFLDRKPQFPVGFEDKYKQSPAQDYNIQLREVAERISEFLKSKNLSSVDSYFDAQEAIARHCNEDWFPELDELFASSLRELAIPLLNAMKPVLSDAREKDDAFFDEVLSRGDLDEPSWRLNMIDVEERIQSTLDLIDNRNASNVVFSLGLHITGWKCLEAMRECEQLIHEELVNNHLMYEGRLTQFSRYGEHRNWRDPLLSDPTSSRPD